MVHPAYNVSWLTPDQVAAARDGLIGLKPLFNELFGTSAWVVEGTETLVGQ